MQMSMRNTNTGAEIRNCRFIIAHADTLWRHNTRTDKNAVQYAQWSKCMIYAENTVGAMLNVKYTALNEQK